MDVMKKMISFFFTSLLLLAAVAQEKQTILIKQPQGGSAVVQTLLKNALTNSAIESGKYQPVEQPSIEDMLNGNDLNFKYMLVTEINELSDKLYVTIRIIEFETLTTVQHYEKEFSSTLRPDELRKKCAEIATELFGADKQ